MEFKRTKNSLIISIPETELKLTASDFTLSESGKQYSCLPAELNSSVIIDGYKYGIYCRVYRNTKQSNQKIDRPEKKKLSNF